jgi:hypothetical protein
MTGWRPSKQLSGLPQWATPVNKHIKHPANHTHYPNTKKYVDSIGSPMRWLSNLEGACHSASIRVNGMHVRNTAAKEISCLATTLRYRQLCDQRWTLNSPDLHHMISVQMLADACVSHQSRQVLLHEPASSIRVPWYASCGTYCLERGVSFFTRVQFITTHTAVVLGVTQCSSMAITRKLAQGILVARDSQ